MMGASEDELERTKEGKRKANDSEAGEMEENGSLTSVTNNRDEDEEPETKKARTTAAIDPEWELFKAQMEATEPESNQPTNEHGDAGAALEAEAQLISSNGVHGDDTQEQAEEEKAEELEAEERARKEQEEREEILSRLEEEQRQQDEADQR